jgi:hypothetical protein
MNTSDVIIPPIESVRNTGAMPQLGDYCMQHSRTVTMSSCENEHRPHRSLDSQTPDNAYSCARARVINALTLRSPTIRSDRELKSHDKSAGHQEKRFPRPRPEQKDGQRQQLFPRVKQTQLERQPKVNRYARREGKRDSPDGAKQSE